MWTVSTSWKPPRRAIFTLIYMSRTTFNTFRQPGALWAGPIHFYGEYRDNIAADDKNEYITGCWCFSVSWGCSFQYSQALPFTNVFIFFRWFYDAQTPHSYPEKNPKTCYINILRKKKPLKSPGIFSSSTCKIIFKTKTEFRGTFHSHLLDSECEKRAFDRQLAQLMASGLITGLCLHNWWIATTTRGPRWLNSSDWSSAVSNTVSETAVETFSLSQTCRLMTMRSWQMRFSW